MKNKAKVNVLFVCMGNICRSPTAEGVFRHIVQENNLHDLIVTDSAGTHAYHVGEAPDRRAQETAKNRGINIADLRARRVHAADFEKFDYVLAMDNDNYAILQDICPVGLDDKLFLFLDFAPSVQATEVPDPYYGGPKGFEVVFDMVEQASLGLLNDIKSKHL
ncbi:MAG: low molecular weight phosphotyrosine protein phosphatase [Gammaproteobacteria bacterium]|nr:low molecular weight phosphotyrosine protein phosphatase [Gammaproteobacteria bacterium]